MINRRLKNLSYIGVNRMETIAIIIVLIISLWSVTKTLEKLADKILEKQNKQNELLEEILNKNWKEIQLIENDLLN
jgi:hypothetical protein